MSTEQVKIVLNAEDQASAAINKVQSELRSLKRVVDSFKIGNIKGAAGLDMSAKVRENFTKEQDAAMRGLRRRFAFEDRMTRQRVAGERVVSAEQGRQERTRRIGEDRAMRDFRDRTAFFGRMMRQQASMERDAERARASAARETIRLDNWRFSLRQRHEREIARDRARADRESVRDARTADRRRADVRREVSRGMGRAGDVSGKVADAARSVSILGAAGAGAIAKIGHMGLEARSRIDTAEANLRMFGGRATTRCKRPGPGG